MLSYMKLLRSPKGSDRQTRKTRQMAPNSNGRKNIFIFLRRLHSGKSHRPSFQIEANGFVAFMEKYFYLLVFHVGIVPSLRLKQVFTGISYTNIEKCHYFECRYAKCHGTEELVCIRGPCNYNFCGFLLIARFQRLLVFVEILK
jgi:hypothetical protein